MTRMARFWIWLSLVTLIGAACSTRSEVALPDIPETSLQRHVSRSPIRHIIVVVQEARTFENLFAGWPGASAPMVGMVQGRGLVPLQPITYRDSRDICDLYGCMGIAFDGGNMDRFNQNRLSSLGSSKTEGNRPYADLLPYSYLNASEITPYRYLAAHFVLADQMYATAWGGDFTAHQDLIAGTTFISKSQAIINVPNARPWGCDAPQNAVVPTIKYQPLRLGPTVRPCFDQYATMADLLDAHHVSWRYYVSPINGTDPSGQLWNAFDAIRRVRYGPDWKANIISPPSRILTDADSDRLPSVSWVIPELKWSDHPSQGSDMGPSWVAAIVNAVGKSKAWDSTAIIVVWSEWGGWYDSEAPKFPPSLKGSGLGFRVPALLVSPYAKSNYVSHTHYQFGSILRFIEQTFELGSLSNTGHGSVYTDTSAASIGDALNFGQSPRPFVPVPAKYDASSFLDNALR